jgi:hypothetical protein
MIKAGFIGTGGISVLHLKYLQTRKDVNITALCDLNRDQALKRQKEFGGVIAAHTHSWVADRWRNEINFSGEENFYRLNLNINSLAGDQPAAAECNLYGGRRKKTAPRKTPFQFQQESRNIPETG